MDDLIQEPWWWNAPQPGAVRVRDGKIEVEAGCWELYNPFDIPNLPNTFAKVDGQKALVVFVQEYGLLGYAGLSEDRDPLEGDPVEWDLAHARAVRFALRLIQARNSASEVKALLEQSVTTIPMNAVIPTAPAGLEAVGHTFPQGQEYRFTLYNEEQWSKEFQTFVPYMLTTMVNGNTCGVRHRLCYQPILHIQLIAEALIEVIWHQVGEIAVMAWHQNGSRIRSCKECGLPFIVTDKRQQFCPKAAVPGERTGSICGARYRQRNRRNPE